MERIIKRVLFHIAFWFSYLLFETFISSYNSQKYMLQFQLHLYYLPIKILATYLNIYYIIPNAFKTGKYFKYIGLFLLSFIIAGILQRINIKYVVIPIYQPDLFDRYTLISISTFTRIWSEYYIVIIASAIKILKNWYESQKNEQLLIKDKLESELNFLKGQIHPHFLFNTLNNLYVLTKKKSDIAPDIVLKLSDILSYILYECNTDKIALSKEIEIIKAIIELEKLRHGDELIITQEFDHKISNNRFIPPLLLLPLLENAFKHGINNHIDKKFISIKTYYDNYFYFEISNSFEEPTSNSETSGIGLKNLKRRLELIYKSDYSLEINKENSNFKAVLGIPIYEK